MYDMSALNLSSSLKILALKPSLLLLKILLLSSNLVMKDFKESGFSFTCVMTAVTSSGLILSRSCLQALLMAVLPSQQQSVGSQVVTGFWTNDVDKKEVQKVRFCLACLLCDMF